METSILESEVYKKSNDVPPTSLQEAPRVKQTLHEISESLDTTIERDSPLKPVHALGKMYRNSINRNADSSEILSHFLDCYYELLHKELLYNSNIEKIEVIKKSIKNIQNTLDILRSLGYECDGEKFKTLLRSFSI